MNSFQSNRDKNLGTQMRKVSGGRQGTAMRSTGGPAPRTGTSFGGLGGLSFMNKTNKSKVGSSSVLGAFKISNQSANRVGPSALGSKMSLTSENVHSNAEIESYVQQKLKQQRIQ